jgi:hypothetical protein
VGREIKAADVFLFSYVNETLWLSFVKHRHRGKQHKFSSISFSVAQFAFWVLRMTGLFRNVTDIKIR